MGTILSKRIVDYSLWVIGGLILISTLTKVRLLIGLFSFQFFWEQAVIIIYFASAIMGTLGLLRFNKWGFIAVYIHILVATIFLSISVIPFLFSLLKLNIGKATTQLLIINFTLLMLTALCHGIKAISVKKLKNLS